MPSAPRGWAATGQDDRVPRQVGYQRPPGGPCPAAPQDCPEIPGPWASRPVTLLVHRETLTEPAGPGPGGPTRPGALPAPPLPGVRSGCSPSSGSVWRGRGGAPRPGPPRAPMCPGHQGPGPPFGRAVFTKRPLGSRAHRSLGTETGIPRVSQTQRPLLSPTHAGPRGGRDHTSRAACVHLTAGGPPTQEGLPRRMAPPGSPPRAAGCCPRPLPGLPCFLFVPAVKV